MLKIIEITNDEQLNLLKSTNFGHLGCSSNDQPYVLPMHYAFDGENLYFLTTEGMKTECLDNNPKVCLQIEKIGDERHWQSVIVLGHAERLTEPEEIGRASNLLYQKHASLTPAINQTIVQGREPQTKAVIYRISPFSITGRETAKE